MLNVKNILSVRTLFLTWQPFNGQGRRFVIGEISKDDFDGYNFTYSINTQDFNDASALGFKGFPAFKIQQGVHRNSLETFMKRLPPKKRKDFKKYLASHNLPEDFSGDNMALLAHTNAKLPGDGFTLVPDLSGSPLPFDYVMEIAGTRHHVADMDLTFLSIGNDVQFVLEDDNKQDENAIALYCDSIKIGYVNKLLCGSFRTLLASRKISAVIIKIKSDQERPLIHILISASENHN